MAKRTQPVEIVYARRDIARAVTEARRSRGWTQQHLAMVAGTTQARVCEVEQCRVDVRVSTVLLLANALNLTLSLD